MALPVLANRNPFQEHLRPPVNIKIASEFASFKREGFDYTTFGDTEPYCPASIDDSTSKKTEDFPKLANLG
jgi:hypothetical protein